MKIVGPVLGTPRYGATRCTECQRIAVISFEVFLPLHRATIPGGFRAALCAECATVAANGLVAAAEQFLQRVAEAEAARDPDEVHFHWNVDSAVSVIVTTETASSYRDPNVIQTKKPRKRVRKKK